MVQAAARPKPTLQPEYCKGCGRCLDACAHHCITPGTTIDPLTGLLPVTLSLDECNGCGLCIDACPEPYGLLAETLPAPEMPTPAGPAPARPPALDLPPVRRALPEGRPLILKGAHASAIGALLAGCRHFFGYPITPST